MNLLRLLVPSKIKLKDRNIYLYSPSKRQTLVAKKHINDANIKATRDFLESIGVSDGMILDIGANIGYYSILYTLAMPDCTIAAFEPSKRSYRFLQMNTGDFHRIMPIHNGFSDTEKKVTLSMPKNLPKDRKGNTGLMSLSGGGNNSEEVQLKTLDDLYGYELGEIYFRNKIQYIKIDVEGHELQVINGGKKTLRKHKPHVELEFNKTIDSDPMRLFKAMKDLNYLPKYFNDNGIESFTMKAFRAKPKVTNVIFKKD